jgi:hypothetical protein
MRKSKNQTPVQKLQSVQDRVDYGALSLQEAQEGEFKTIIFERENFDSQWTKENIKNAKRKLKRNGFNIIENQTNDDVIVCNKNIDKYFNVEFRIYKSGYVRRHSYYQIGALKTWYQINPRGYYYKYTGSPYKNKKFKRCSYTKFVSLPEAVDLLLNKY